MARTKTLMWHQFVRLWAARATSWLTLKRPTIVHRDIKLFADYLLSLVSEGKLLHPNLQHTPPTPPISKAQLRKQRKLEKAERDSHNLNAYLTDLIERGCTIVFIDGSSEKVSGVGFVGGYGIYSENPHAISSHLPINIRQTNNAPEIFAAIHTLKLVFPTMKVAICTDSSLVYVGATGKAQK